MATSRSFDKQSYSNALAEAAPVVVELEPDKRGWVARQLGNLFRRLRDGARDEQSWQRDQREDSEGGAESVYAGLVVGL